MVYILWRSVTLGKVLMIGRLNVDVENSGITLETVSKKLYKLENGTPEFREFTLFIFKKHWDKNRNQPLPVLKTIEEAGKNLNSNK